MKKRIYFSVMAAAVTMFTACTSDDLPQVPVVDEMTDTPVTITAGVAELTTRAETTTPLTSGSLGLYFTTPNNNDTKYNATNREVKYESSKWVIQGTAPLLWINSTTDINYKAYHPFVSTVTNGAISVTAPTDLLFGSGTTNGTTSAKGIAIKLNHQMAKLTVNLRAGSEVAKTTTFSSVAIKELKNTRVFDLANGSWKDIDENATATDISMTLNTESNAYEAILIPQTITDFVVTIATSDKTFKFTQSNVTLAAGTAYTLNLVVGKDKVTLADNNGITITDWTNVTGGQLETE